MDVILLNHIFQFNAGDLIVVHERVDNEWLRGELNKKFGIFPASFVQSADGSAPQLPSSPTKRTVTALYDYNSGVPDDLAFCANDVIEIVEEVGIDWMKGRLNGRSGEFT